MYPKVSIIILNWNGWKDTVECLESLYQITYPNYEVIVVDNDSKDESVQKIKEWAKGKIEVNSKFFKYNSTNKPIKYFEYTKKELENKSYLKGKRELDNLPSNKKLFILKNDKNYGFAEGNNIAIRQVLKENKSDYVLLLNNDTVVDPNFLTELAKVAESDSKIGSIGPDIRLFKYPRKPQIKKYGSLRKATEVDTLSGACILIRVKTLRETGLLDKTYFLYDEDRDLCERINKAGYRIIYLPTQSKIYHKISESTKEISGLRIYYTTRNKFLILRRYRMNIKGIISFHKEMTKNFLSEIIISKNIKFIKYLFKGILHGGILFIKNPKPSASLKENNEIRMSVCIVTYNAEKKIKRCLESITGLGNEIIIVDLSSTDKTIEIAKEYTDKIYYHKKVPFAELGARNYAISKTTNRWVLILDPDEYITLDLKQEIINLFKQNKISKYNAYRIPIRDYMWGKITKHGLWGRTIIRLFNKNFTIWPEKIHAKPIIRDRKIGKLKHPFIHYSHLTMDKTIQKFNKYTEFEAVNLYKRFKNKNIVLLWVSMATEANKQFLVTYVYRKGFMEGWHGLIAAYLRMFYAILSYIKTYELLYKSKKKELKAKTKN